jgi:hypothetical protein
MKNSILTLVFASIVTVGIGQNSFGKHIYPHLKSECSSGATGIVNPGFLLGGYVAQAPPGQANFYIDRTDKGGVFTGAPYEFQRDYYAFGSYTCNFGMPNQIPDCAGISVIEDPASNGYLAVGATQYCAYLTSLGPNGIPNQSVAYKFSKPSNDVTKPIICRSNVYANQYYFAGAYEDTMYIFRVDNVGAIQASHAVYLNTINIVPQAIIESPYGSNDLTIVGTLDKTIDYDALFFQIDNNLSSPVTVLAYELGMSMANNSTFLSITSADPANSSNPGFLIGGNSDVNGSGQAWMCKLDPSGTPIWSKIITGTYAPQNYSVMAVAERYSIANNLFESYGAAISALGIVTYKLDDNGGVPMSLVNGSSDEFNYNDGSASYTRPVAISFYNNGAPFDEGLHVYGNSENVPGGHYLVESYFSGEAGCNNSVTSLSLALNKSMWNYLPWYTSISPPTICNFTVYSTPANSYQVGCPPIPGLPPPASNNRVTSVMELDQNKDLNVIPNPSEFYFSFAGEGVDPGTITVKDIVGHDCKFILHESPVNGSQIKLEPSDWNPGVYFLSLKKNGGSKTTKLVYVR